MQCVKTGRPEFVAVSPLQEGLKAAGDPVFGPRRALKPPKEELE